MATPFNDIYNKFFLQIGDDAKRNLLRLASSDLEDLLYSWLEESVVSFKKCKQPIEEKINRIDSQFDELILTLEEKSILGLGMVLVWLKPRVLTLQNLKQNVGDRDFKRSSNWQTLNSLMVLEEKTEDRLKTKIKSYTYNKISEIPVKK